MKEKPSILQIIGKTGLGLSVGIGLAFSCYMMVMELIGDWSTIGISFWIVFESCIYIILIPIFFQAGLLSLFSVYHGLFHGEWKPLKKIGSGSRDVDMWT
jgi:hypothetical protein